MSNEHILKLHIRIPPFVLNLYKILSEPKYSDVVAWESSGTRFVVKDSINFASRVLPHYYHTNKLASFSRQLNIYGFYRASDRRRTKQSADKSMIIYSHQHFRRDQPNSLHLIQRTLGQYTQAKAEYSIQEPITKPVFPRLPTASLSLASSKFLSIDGEGKQEDLTELIPHCFGCIALEQEKVTLINVIQYYMSIINEPDNVPSNYQEVWYLSKISPSFASSAEELT